MKLQIFNEFGSPLNLQGVDSIKFKFPYENGEVLEKNNVEILDFTKGTVKIELSDFEIQGLKTGEKQNFYADIVIGRTKYTVEFTKGLNVLEKNQRKVLNESKDRDQII